MTTQREKGEAFRSLHAGEPFVIPNPWDAGSARVLEGLGFRALATTSSGFAWSLGRRDRHITLDESLGHLRAMSASEARLADLAGLEAALAELNARLAVDLRDRSSQAGCVL